MYDPNIASTEKCVKHQLPPNGGSEHSSKVPEAATTVEELYERHRGLVFNVCGQRLGHEIAHDAAQEVWLRVTKNPKAITGYEYGEENALWRLAQNTAITMRNSLRRDAKRNVPAQIWAEDENGQPELIDHPGVQNRTVAESATDDASRELGEELWGIAVDVLSDRQLLAVCLFQGHCVPQIEIAEHMGVEPGTIRATIDQAKKKISKRAHETKHLHNSRHVY